MDIDVQDTSQEPRSLDVVDIARRSPS